MAAIQDAQPADVETPAETSPKSRRRLIVGASITAVVLAAAGGGAYYYFTRDAAAATAETVKPAAPSHKVALYLMLKPDFIVNSTAVGQRRYLQTSLAVVARDQAVIDALNAHAPIVRSALINLLADQDFMVLQTADGKQALRDKMRATIDATLMKEGAGAGVEAVLFNSFVMQ
jgi:flagellar protein FliL